MAETSDTGESIEHSARVASLKLGRLPVMQEAAGLSRGHDPQPNRQRCGFGRHT